jgi:Fe/S biogenesis protein NfuA
MTNDIITISDSALETILDVRSREPDAEDLALSLAVTGARGLEFTYELTFVAAADAGNGDAVGHHGDLTVIIPEKSISDLRGARLDVDATGLAIDNPNTPSPEIPIGDTELTGTLAERVGAVLEQHINPQIAMHGGWAELADVDGDTIYLRLGGGCQGCGMAQVTLRQGIEAALRQAVPDIGAIMDVTDHSSGANPYY